MSVRIGFSGCPGTGKSSLAAYLRGDLKSGKTRVSVELVTEYARRYIVKYGLPERVLEQQRMLWKQVDWEDSTCTGKIDFILTDSPIFLGFMYALQLRNIHDTRDMMFLNDLFKDMSKLNVNHRYKVIFHLPPTKAPIDDGVRAAEQLTDEWRQDSDDMLHFIFKLFPPRHFIVLKETSVQKQAQECKEHLDRLGIVGEPKQSSTGDDPIFIPDGRVLHVNNPNLTRDSFGVVHTIPGITGRINSSGDFFPDSVIDEAIKKCKDRYSPAE